MFIGDSQRFQGPRIANKAGGQPPKPTCYILSPDTCVVPLCGKVELEESFFFLSYSLYFI